MVAISTSVVGPESNHTFFQTISNLFILKASHCMPVTKVVGENPVLTSPVQSCPVLSSPSYLAQAAERVYLRVS